MNDLVIGVSARGYRLQHAALEVSLDLLDRFPAADADGDVRRQLEAALWMLLRRIWPYLDELDEREEAGADGNGAGSDADTR